MTDNEKAAIAAGLWTPGQRCGCEDRPGHTHRDECFVLAAPDMHDPANLWRALEHPKSKAEVIVVINEYRNRDIAKFVFAALVALYDADAEHA